MSDQPTKSRFYPFALEILLMNAPKPMGVSEIIKEVTAKRPEAGWGSHCSGPVHAILCSMAANSASPIQSVPGSKPARFFVEAKESQVPGSVQRQKDISDDFTPKQEKKHKSHKVSPDAKPNSMFYEPCCTILAEKAPSPMSANELTKAIIERYPNLEWSHSQGPVRAMLISADAKPASPIKKQPGTTPPLFFYAEIGKAIKSESVVVEESSEEIMEKAYFQTQKSLKEKLIEKIKSLPPTSFEHLANNLVAKMLFGKEENTPPTGDGGIDGFIHIYEDPLGLNVVGIQAKRYTEGNVQASEIQKFIGALHGMNGVFVTCADFSPGAKNEAAMSKFSKIVLVNGKQMVEYMVQYRVGVKETGKVYNLTEIDEEFFEEL